MRHINLLKTSFYLSVLLAISSCSFTYQDTIETDIFGQACMAGAQPIISVSDFDGNGFVDENDISEINSAIHESIYFTIYDRNTDGVINEMDVELAKSELDSVSTSLDQKIASLFHETKFLQQEKGRTRLKSLGFHQGAESIAGHGEHWNNEKGSQLIDEGGDIQFEEAVGLNVPKASGRVWALFWGLKAQLEFENGASDYPVAGGVWETEQVVAFSGSPPNFTGDDSEAWHTHAGLCSAPQEKNGKLVAEHLSQHLSYAQCQTKASVALNIGEENGWINIWMLHAWIFVPNPNGLFANTHPCIDQDSPSEDMLNGSDTIIPEFFQHHH